MSEMKNIAAEKLRIAMIKNNNMKLSELAQLTGMSAPNASNKFRRNDFRESEIRRFADMLGFDVEISLISRKTGERV